MTKRLKDRVVAVLGTSARSEEQVAAGAGSDRPRNFSGQKETKGISWCTASEADWT